MHTIYNYHVHTIYIIAYYIIIIIMYIIIIISCMLCNNNAYYMSTCMYNYHLYNYHVMLHHVTRVSTDWACPVAHGKEKKMATSPSIVQALATLAGALSSTSTSSNPSESQAATPRSQERR